MVPAGAAQAVPRIDASIRQKLLPLSSEAGHRHLKPIDGIYGSYQSYQNYMK